MKKTKPVSDDFREGRGYTRADWDEVDDNPEMTEAEIAELRPFREVFPDLAASIDRKLGRPKAENPKKAISLRLDQDVIDRFKATGDGWQSRMNEALRKAVGL
ncbi:BrnA antitoxin family protein [Rhizobium sp. WL3]|uniref:BrnA antitoxin family protein n=1 Tax=Rhizobium sp. WL3 TaxID=2603277 RepID=UPI0011C1D4C1|nr:BrnA antitoxin family protein [Rhizobium sp. WL3]QEE47044.1 BrnA antitoxin family protein [Rhizobium sp. WL3]